MNAVKMPQSCSMMLCSAICLASVVLPPPSEPPRVMISPRRWPNSMSVSFGHGVETPATISSSSSSISKFLSTNAVGSGRAARKITASRAAFSIPRLRQSFASFAGSIAIMAPGSRRQASLAAFLPGSSLSKTITTCSQRCLISPATPAKLLWTESEPSVREMTAKSKSSYWVPLLQDRRICRSAMQSSSPSVMYKVLPPICLAFSQLYGSLF